MIKEVHLTRFKKYKERSFSLTPKGVSLLVGGNNSGKSTLIHALAVWEFCKMILVHEKGRSVFNQTELGMGEGFGMSAEEFLPIAVPSLNHLWTNLKTQLSTEEKKNWPDKYPGYIMRIRCVWDYKEQLDKMLEIGLSLVNDRLFIRVTNSNLNEGDYLPVVVYLPTFAGVLPKESKATIAERRAYLGRGMAGSIIRNMIYDLYSEDRQLREKLLSGKSRLQETDKKIIKEDSPYEKLQVNLRNTFASELEVEPFNENFNTVLKINERKLKREQDGTLSLIPKSKYTPRDSITQGSGYLQWLSIFCNLYHDDIDVLLLDEPDAHLHASLQSELLKKLLEDVAGRQEKQILISTHSVEMIKQAPLEIIFSMDKRRYLKEEESRVMELSGIGSEYFPKLDLLKRYKRLFFVENESDKRILSILGEKCGIHLPEEIVYWTNTESHATRKQIFTALQKIIPDLRCISLRDRDMDNPETIGEKLVFKGIKNLEGSGILLLEWKRKNIESYLMCPRAIASATGYQIEDIKKHIQDYFALAINDSGFVETSPPEAIITCDGKHIFNADTIGLEVAYRCNKYDVAEQMLGEEVCEDVKIVLEHVKKHFSDL